MTGRPKAASISALPSGRSGSAPQFSSVGEMPSRPRLISPAKRCIIEGVGEEIGRLEAVEPLDDLGERQGRRERAARAELWRTGEGAREDGGGMGGVRGGDERTSNLTIAAGVPAQPERGPFPREPEAQPSLESACHGDRAFAVRSSVRKRSS